MRFFVLIIAIILLSASDVSAKTLQDGLTLYRMGHYPEAEMIFRELALKKPHDYTAKYMLAVTLVNMQRYNEAKALYKNVISRSNNDRLIKLCRTGLSNLGETYGSYYQPNITKAVLNVNIAGGVIVVNDVLLNNTLKTKLILDTGASFTMISKATARKLNIRTNGVQTVKIMTGSGYINAPLVKIPEIEVKGLIVRNVDAIVADLPVHTSGDSHEIAGLLGLSFLENFRISIDRANNLVVLEKN